MWTPTIQEKVHNGDSLRVRVKFSDGVQNFEQLFFAVNLADLKAQVASHIARLTGIDALSTALPTGAFDATPDAVPVSPQESAKVAYNNALYKLVQYQKLADSGVIKADDPDYLSAQQLVKDTFDPSYI